MRHDPRIEPSVDVLIVEDDEAARGALRRLLEGAGYACAEAGDGTEALEAARQRPPRLVLLDLLMPGMDGLAVARELRADPRTHDLPVYCLTGWDEPAVRRQAQRAGCEAFLTKPVDPVALLDAVLVVLHPGGPRAARPEGAAPGGGAGVTAADAADLIALLYGALRAFEPRWLLWFARWLEERVAPHHADTPLALRLAAHLRRAAGTAEAALAAVERRTRRHRGPHGKRRGPHPCQFRARSDDRAGREQRPGGPAGLPGK
jgi:CheY-like chemotaxis protein